MYTPTSFAVTDHAEVTGFIHEHAFGQLTSSYQGRLMASHLPFIYQPEQSLLLGHMAKQNPQHQELENQEVMLSFSGPHAYISPSWYAVDGGVPTWNYQVVHVYGTCRLFDDPQRLRSTVDALTAVYEAKQQQPWQPNYPERMLQAIIGIEINITEIQAKFKLSQNRPTADQQQVIEQLHAGGQSELAAVMQSSLKQTPKKC